MKLNNKYWENFQKWMRIILSFVIYLIILVLYFDSTIILKNKYHETNNNLYLFVSFILMILYVYYCFS